jgi:hypothetical protein
MEAISASETTADWTSAEASAYRPARNRCATEATSTYDCRSATKSARPEAPTAVEAAAVEPTAIVAATEPWASPDE